MTASDNTRVPDAIAAYANKRAGKAVTKADAVHLEAQLGVPMCIRRQYGMTHVTWPPSAGSRDEHSILLAHSETNVHWPSGHMLIAREPAYFAARDERNAARKTLLSTHRKDNPSHIKRAAAAIVKHREAQDELLQLVGYGQPMHVVRYAVEKLTGKD